MMKMNKELIIMGMLISNFQNAHCYNLQLIGLIVFVQF